MHDPGHSGLRSVDIVVVDGFSSLEGFGRDFVVLVSALVLSQQTEPLLQLDVYGIKTEGLSQNAAIIFNKQNPAQRGPELVTFNGCIVVLVVNGLIVSVDFQKSYQLTKKIRY